MESIVARLYCSFKAGFASPLSLIAPLTLLPAQESYTTDISSIFSKLAHSVSHAQFQSIRIASNKTTFTAQGGATRGGVSSRSYVRIFSWIAHMLAPRPVGCQFGSAIARPCRNVGIMDYSVSLRLPPLSINLGISYSRQIFLILVPPTPYT